jgi:trigger factor
VVEVTILGTEGEETVVDRRDVQAMLQEDTPPPGFAEAVTGMSADETREFTLTYPEDYEEERLAAKAVAFSVSLAQVYEMLTPELDDDLARTVGNYETFDELEASVRERLKERERARAESEYAEQVLAGIIEQAELSYPPLMLEEALDDAVENYEQRIEREEHMMLEDYLRIQGRTMDDLREDLKPDVKASLERALVLGEVVDHEDLEVSDEALDVQIAESSEQYGDLSEEIRERLNRPEGRRGLRNRMLANAAVERLVAIAKGEAPKVGEAGDEEVSEEASEEEDSEGE